MTEALHRVCPLCEGRGCSECDGTGERVTTWLDAGDGITARVHGSADLDDEARDALIQVMRAASRFMELDVIRVDGGVACSSCGAAYRDHPWDENELSGIDGLPYLRISCDGRRLKL